jgi:hypothetical protein
VNCTQVKILRTAKEASADDAVAVKVKVKVKGERYGETAKHETQI